MNDQDVITRLVQLHDHIQPPGTSGREDALRGQRLVRRRRTLGAVAAVAGVVLTVGTVQASLSDDPRDLEPAPAPTTAPTTTAPSVPGETPSDGGDVFATRFGQIVAQVPDWTVEDSQPSFTRSSCAGDWAPGGGFGGGSFSVTTAGGTGQVWHQVNGSPSAAKASEAVDTLVQNLTSCDAVAWQARPIADTGAVLVSSADGVIWVLHQGEQISFLEAPTSDGPPPLDVQIEIVDLMLAHLE